MAVEIRVPQLGESIVEATVTRWLKHEGEPVAQGDVLVELETDKINVEVQSDTAGVLERVTRQEGETIGVNEVIALIGDAAGNGAASKQAEVKTSAAGVAAEPVNQGESVAAEEAALTTVPENGRGKATAATPVAQKIAAENRVDLAQVKGSGPEGKILKEDVEGYLSQQQSAPKTAPAAQTAPVTPVVSPALPSSRPAETPRAVTPLFPPVSNAPDRRETRKPMSPKRQTIAKRLVEAQHNAAMLTTFNEVDMTSIMEIRKRRRDSFKEKHGVGLGFMSFFTKAVVGALKAFPLINAEIQGNEIVLKHYYDIGIAVGAEDGLVVPVLRDADRKSFAEIEKGIGDLATRAREKKLAMSDLIGGTFTITNGGIFGSLMSTPILNAPQVGILGMHKIQERPVVVNGEIAIRPMMYLALSYDHRIVDGSEAVRFLVKVKELLEDPETLLLEG